MAFLLLWLLFLIASNFYQHFRRIQRIRPARFPKPRRFSNKGCIRDFGV
ncbi:Uncharacterized protein dnm_087500 [Desulfonema magnum]|uniref:Uncharacterized protein n=1 Tax=Desulfonema magnum TaxID=45655 RepID=A0A975BVZ8_9BACT|nr:Uncharacterized protein dnm_087500 [Desulfonema magnum]